MCLCIPKNIRFQALSVRKSWRTVIHSWEMVKTTFSIVFKCTFQLGDNRRGTIHSQAECQRYKLFSFSPPPPGKVFFLGSLKNLPRALINVIDRWSTVAITLVFNIEKTTWSSAFFRQFGFFQPVSHSHGGIFHHAGLFPILTLYTTPFPSDGRDSGLPYGKKTLWVLWE